MTRKHRVARRSGAAANRKTGPTRLNTTSQDGNRIVRRRAGPLGTEAPASANFASGETWKLEEAKAKFSEVVRRAQSQGPQFVTVRGKEAVAVIDAAELRRLLPIDQTLTPLVDFLESLYVEGLNLRRDPDRGRDAAL